MPTEYRYPTYQSHPDISATVYQSGEDVDWGQKYVTVTRTYIGPDNDILDMGSAYKVGTSITIGNGLSGSIQSCKTTKMDADRSKLVYVARTTSYSGGDEDDPNILNAVWQVNMAQMEIPLYRYCSPTVESGYGSAVDLDGWESEQDKTLKKAYQYQPEPWNDTSPPVSLTGRTLDLAKLIASGTEARLIFYPQASLVTTCRDYTQIPNFSTRIGALNYIDNTPSALNLGQTYSWLKTGFDIQQNQDSTWNLTESWIGSPSMLGDWSPGLYDKTNGWSIWKESN